MDTPILSPSHFDLPSQVPTSKNAPLVAVPWSKFGSRRLYVHTADGQLVGWIDLKTGHRALVMTDRALAFELALSEAETAGTADLTQNRRSDQLAARIARNQADVQSAPMRHAYSGTRALSTRELGPRGNRVIADEPSQLFFADPHSTYLHTASAR